jgi:hypothetical protein
MQPIRNGEVAYTTPKIKQERSCNLFSFFFRSTEEKSVPKKEVKANVVQISHDPSSVNYVANKSLYGPVTQVTYGKNSPNIAGYSGNLVIEFN